MRSFLFVPGDSAAKLAKAMASGADALIIDLEDSVAAGNKSAAHATSLAFLREALAEKVRPRLFVRVNGLSTGLIEQDLDAVMPAGPDGLVLPKTEGGMDVTHLSAKLAVREAEYNLADGSTSILAITTETAKGVFALGTFAGCSHRLMGLAWGAEDLSADLGAETNRQADGRYAEPYRLARSLTLMGAAAAELAPVDAVFTQYRDLEGLEQECEAARRDGFTGKMAIHPAQIAVINRIFTPTPEALERAQAIVDAFAADPGAGVIGLGGEMLDRPHLVRALRTLARGPKQ
jgi:citrate lyase subunit beta / citryl-CoA lyase